MLTASAAFAAEGTETVVVTGSRIPQANAVAPTAVSVVDQTDLQIKGTINVASALRDMPSVGVSGYSSTNTNFSTAGVGINSVELRNLGEARTLVLVNGRRYVAGVAGSNTVDFNSIPTQMIDRVEVITGGASAIYGSDALAGVVNVLLKTDFEGITAGYQGGVSEFGDAVSHKIDATIGGNFANGKGNAFVSLAWSHEGGVKSANRPDNGVDNYAECYYYGEDINRKNCETMVLGTYSSYGANGRFFYNDNGDSATISSGTGSTGTVSPWSTSKYGYNRQAWRMIQVPVDRLLLAANAHYNFSDSLQGYIETTFANSSSSQRMEPFAADAGIGNNSLNNGGVSIDNPYMPAALRAAAIAGGYTELPFYRRMVEFGPRQSTARRDTYRFVTGLKGTVLDRFNWDVSFDWGHTFSSQDGTGQINVSNFREALNATTDSDGNIVCASATAVAEGCAPINIFGKNSISAAAIKYINAPQSRTDNIDQKVVQAQVEGALFALPAGDVHLATGFEWRRESSSEVPDALTQTGQNGSNTEAATKGSFNVVEYFAEVQVPVLKDLFLVKDLSLSAAMRYSSYNFQGVTSAYTGRISYSPIDDLRFRIQYARAVRAPNINELFAPGGEDFATVTDPCNGVTAAQTTQLAKNCLANPYVAARVAATGSLNLSLAEMQSTGGFNFKGSTALKPETSDSWSMGVVYNHDFGNLGTLDLSLDYYDIRINDYITTVGRQQALNLCYGAATTVGNPFCAMVVRQSVGSAPYQGAITELNTGYVNAGWDKTSGLETQFGYGLDLNSIEALKNGSLIGLSDAGVFHARFNWVWMMSDTSNLLNTLTPYKGNIYEPVHKVQAVYMYTNGPLTLQWETEFRASTVESQDKTDPYYGLPHPDYFMHSIAVNYQVTPELEAYMGVNNVFDTQAPIVLSGINSNTTGTNTAADVFDALGRRYYFGLRLKM
jgi:outer membrane receptor protein involved in Fe transport